MTVFRGQSADADTCTPPYRIDYDKVIVLSHGRLLEHDTPWTLLQDPNSAFYSLCEATGTVEFDALKRAAETASATRP